MNVGAILEGKSGNIISVGPKDDLTAVTKLLARHKIGAVIVLEKDKICGIISERDIVRELAANGETALNRPVSNCMTKKVISCSRNDSVDHVMGIMSTGKFRHIPVTDGDTLVGIISIGDVVKKKIEQAERDAEDMRSYISAS